MSPLAVLAAAISTARWHFKRFRHLTLVAFGCRDVIAGVLYQQFFCFFSGPVAQQQG